MIMPDADRWGSRVSLSLRASTHGRKGMNFTSLWAAACANPKPGIFVLTLFGSVTITILANWRRKGGGRLQAEHFFVGAELATGAVISGVTLLIAFASIILCSDGQWKTVVNSLYQAPDKAVSPFLILLELRLFRYCRNQERRAIKTGMTIPRGLRNTLVGSLAFTASLIGFHA